MRIIAIGEWKPSPGRTVTFEPTARCREAAERAAEYRGPITFLTRNHVRTEAGARRRAAPYRSFIGSTREVMGCLDTDALTRALVAFVCRHDVLRMWFESDGSDVRARLVPPDDIEFAARRGTTHQSSSNVRSYVHDRFENEGGSDTFPGLVFGVVERAADFSVYLACDHAISDGTSQALALTEILADYRRLVSDPAIDLYRPATQPGYLQFAALEAAVIEEHRNGSRLIDRWKDIFARHDYEMPRFPLDLGLRRGETAPVFPLRQPLLDRAGITAFDSACRASGGRFVDGLYAAIAITGFELAGTERYFGMSVFDSRAALSTYAMAQGWLCGFAPVEFAIAGSATFGDLVPAAQEARREARQLAGVPIPSALASIAAASAHPDAIMSAPNLFSYMDFRYFSGTCEQPSEPTSLFTGQGRTANASAWVTRDHDELVLGSQAPDTPLARARAQAFYRHVQEVMTNIARTGDHLIGTCGIPQTPTPGTCSARVPGGA